MIKMVYAICTADGHFKELRVFDLKEIVSDIDQTEDGVYILKTLHNEDMYFLESIAIEG